MNDELLRTPLFLEQTLLKNFLQELKSSILQNGGRNFSEWANGRGDGAANAELKFSWNKEIWEITISTGKRRTTEIQTEVKRIFFKKVETKKRVITLEISFSLTTKQESLPSYIIRAIQEKNSSIKKEKNGVCWTYLLHKEQEWEQTESETKGNGIIVQDLFQKEKANMMKNAEEILETIFEIKRDVEESNKQAAK
ncbi:hypothetical protein EXS74_03675 [Candidatus Woesearchaeota archaeon]|nr:hypothetical protein [Candidatus Woesearchaeota archaeon]